MFGLLVAFLGQAKAPPAFPLTVPSIMRGYALVGHAPRGLRWSADGSLLRFTWAKADGSAEPPFKSYTVRRDGSGLAAVTDQVAFEEPLPYGPERSGERKVYTQGGDLYLFDNTTKKSRRLTQTTEAEDSPVFVEDGKAVVYQRGDNLYRLDLVDGSTVQLTDIHPAPPAPAEPPATNPSQTALAEEQTKLFKAFSGGGFRRGPRGSRGGGSTGDIVSITIPAGFRVGSVTVSPSGKAATVEFTEPPSGDRIAQVPSYVTRSGYTEMIDTYEKVGDRQGRGKLLAVDLESGATTELAPARLGVVNGAQWSPNGRWAVAWAYAEDHKDAWLLAYDAQSHKISTVWDEHDDAWTGGPGQGTLGWIGNRLYFESEKTGFAHLMTANPDGSDVRALTEGRFEVSNVTVDAPRKRFLFVSSEGGPAVRHVDAVGFEGGARTKLADLSADDDAAYVLSPDGQILAVVRSKPNHPGELFLGGTQVTETPTAEWLGGPWIVPPVVQVKVRDGVEVPARLYKPKDWKKGGPAVVFVHGAGYLQNVFDGWSYYYREFMFHHLLMSRGYAVLDMDYRGSAGYGRDWRTAIYRHMGGKDLDDEVDGARWLVSSLGADPKRLGVYGGSYGGFMTLMAMFTAPGTFAAGAALRPVADWANYNHGYTSEILNQPQDDPTAYRQSSPIFFAEGLKGSLLICHGMVDTNVHFQDSVRLSERLIELGKEDWQIAPYPVEDHAFRRPESWTDEYRRILALFERTIGPGYKKP